VQPDHADEVFAPHHLDRPEAPPFPVDLGIDPLGERIARGPGPLAQPFDDEGMVVEGGERRQVRSRKGPEE
jgi:hypothetical protein